MSEHETKYLMARKTIINTVEVSVKVCATYGPRASEATTNTLNDAEPKRNYNNYNYNRSNDE